MTLKKAISICKNYIQKGKFDENHNILVCFLRRNYFTWFGKDKDLFLSDKTIKERLKVSTKIDIKKDIKDRIKKIIKEESLEKTERIITKFCKNEFKICNNFCKINAANNIYIDGIAANIYQMMKIIERLEING